MTACPEPYGLAPEITSDFELQDPAKLFGAAPFAAGKPVPVPDERLPLPETRPLVTKGTYASSIGALLAGCRHFFGYPITPSTEGAELMAKLLPQLDGVFVQAVSEVATVNMMYGCGGAGLPAMTFTSSPGFSLMLEGISYMIGAEVPGVFVDVMRGGPGLGNIAPEQADIKLACRGLGHGNTHAVVLAPSTPQEMLDLTMLAFELSFKYRNPVVILCDGYLGQMTGKVSLPDHHDEAGPARVGGLGRRGRTAGNLISSIQLDEADLEAHNLHLDAKYAAHHRGRAAGRPLPLRGRGRRWWWPATPRPGWPRARSRRCGSEGVRGRPLPTAHAVAVPDPGAPRRCSSRAERLVVVEASSGQLEDELRLAVSQGGPGDPPPIDHVRHRGGVLPQQAEIVERVLAGNAVAQEGVPV